MNRSIINSRDDEDLRALLAKWDAPQVSSELDDRVLASFRLVSPKSQVLPSRAWHKAQVSFRQKEVITMKHCPSCNETFSTMFKFCPIDSALLVDDAEPLFNLEFGETEILYVPSSGAYQLTMMDDAGLVRRLIKEVRATAKQLRLAIPEIKSDPIGFIKTTASVYSQSFFRFVTSPNTAVALVVALMFMLTTVAGIAMLDRFGSSLTAQDNVRDDLQLQSIIDISKVEDEKDKGNAGTAKGNGGGSGEKDKPQGGGGGGREEIKTASNGKPPVATENPPLKTPEVIPPPLTSNPLNVKTTIQGDEVILPEDTRPIPYGVADSASLDPSNGTGKGDGQGNNKGAGNGDGDGNGKDKGIGENIGGDKAQTGCCGTGGGNKQTEENIIFRPPQVQRKAQITFNPQPQYTEEARKNQVQGVVRISMVMTASGQVQNIRVVSGLPNGLTEKSLEAARLIRFIPAQKDGRNVSQYVTVEYNFRIY